MQLRRSKQVTLAGTAVVAAGLVLVACTSSSTSSSKPGTLKGTINGSGSTFQLPFQQQAITQFKSVQPGVTVNYGGGGSGKGRTDLSSGVVNFAGSDSPIPSSEASNFKGKKILYFPVVIGPITVSYNLPGVKNLKLDGPVIARIFQDQITKWNDPAITALNPGVSLPDTPITIVHRSDSSGTTQNFSQYLVQAAPSEWKLGSNSTINWPPASRAGSGNGGVAQIVKSTPGAIGYVDYADAKASGLVFASIKNSSGKFVTPSTGASSDAAGKVKVMPNLTFSAIDAPGASSYPITYQSWVLVNAKQPNASDAKNVKAYVSYLLGPGQKLLPKLGYAPLPSNIDAKAKAELSKIGPK